MDSESKGVIESESESLQSYLRNTLGRSQRQWHNCHTWNLESGSQGVKESRCQGVKESRSQSQSVSKIILEMSKVYPIIIDSARVDRRWIYDNDDRQTDKQTQWHLYSLKRPTFSRRLKMCIFMQVFQKVSKKQNPSDSWGNTVFLCMIKRNYFQL